MAGMTLLYLVLGTFFGFVLKYTLPFMGPMLVLIWLLFFRR